MKKPKENTSYKFYYIHTLGVIFEVLKIGNHLFISFDGRNFEYIPQVSVKSKQILYLGVL